MQGIACDDDSATIVRVADNDAEVPRRVPRGGEYLDTICEDVEILTQVDPVAEGSEDGVIVRAHR